MAYDDEWTTPERQLARYLESHFEAMVEQVTQFRKQGIYDPELVMEIPESFGEAVGGQFSTCLGLPIVLSAVEGPVVTRR